MARTATVTPLAIAAGRRRASLKIVINDSGGVSIEFSNLGMLNGVCVKNKIHSHLHHSHDHPHDESGDDLHHDHDHVDDRPDNGKQKAILRQGREGRQASHLFITSSIVIVINHKSS